MTTPIRVLIADDHPLIALALTPALRSLGIEVVATATTVEEVVEKYVQVKPDVVVLDIRFRRGLTGLEVARELVQGAPPARIVFYSQFDQDEVLKEAYRVGGMAFVTKDKGPALLADAIKQAHAGQIFFLREIAERLALINLRGDESPQAKLELRELQVFRLMAEGFTNVEIAQKMNLSTRTITTLTQTVKEKLGVQRQADLTRLALKHQIIE